MIIRTTTNTNSIYYKIYPIISKILIFLSILFAFTMPIHPDIGRKVITFAFIILIFVIDYKKLYKLIISNKFLLAFTLFVLFAALSILWSENTKEASLQVRGMLKYWYFPTLVLISIIEKKFIKYLIYAFLAGMFINIILSYSIYFYHIKTFLGHTLTIRSYVPFHASHMEYSVFISLSIFLFFYFSIKNKNIILKSFLIIIAISMIILLFLMPGRTGQLGFILTAILLSIIYFKHNIKLLIFSFIILCGILFTSYTYSKTFHSRINSTFKQIQNFKNNSELGVRLSSYLIIPELINTTNIVYGTGLGDSRQITKNIALKKYGKNSVFKRQKGKLHQTFLTIFHSLGIIGFLLFIYLYSLIVFSKQNDNDIKFIKYVFSITILIPLMSNELFGQREIMLLFALFASIIIFENKNNKLLSTK